MENIFKVRRKLFEHKYGEEAEKILCDHWTNNCFVELSHFNNWLVFLFAVS